MSMAQKGINNKIKWEMRTHVNGTEYHSLLYRAKFMQKGIQMEIHTPVTNHWGDHKKFGQAEVSFFIDGDEREFKTEEEMINAIKQT